MIKNFLKRFLTLFDRANYYNYLENNFIDKKDFICISDSSYNNKNSVKPIAFYLPQFHSIQLNDENFGKGFTEWTNVSKCFPQFKGHYQPHIPIDVGFYDLSTDKVMYRQIKLAKQYGIYAFCFHYYWFSGDRLLETPIFNYLKNKELDLPFCLCWANENWSKLWDGGNCEILYEQKLSADDDKKFFYDILPFFKDSRYIKIDNKPLLVIYRLNLFEKDRIKNFIDTIKKLAVKEGFSGVHVVGANSFCLDDARDYGADCTLEFPPHGISDKNIKIKNRYTNKNSSISIVNLKKYVEKGLYLKSDNNSIYKGIFPSWDNSARKAKSGAIVYLSNPEIYKIWLRNIIKWTIDNHIKDDRYIFINAWNEWAEGAHLEPDLKYGYAYLQATKDALEETSDL